MFLLLSLLLSIFVTYPKEKIKENDFFFLLKNLGTPEVHMQKYLKSTSTQKVFGMGMALFLEYLYFIAQISIKSPSMVYRGWLFLLTFISKHIQ